MDTSQIIDLQGKWLKASDIDDLGGSVVVQLADPAGTMETVRDPQSGKDVEKLAVHFDAEELPLSKPYLTNKSNYGVITGARGKQSEDWSGLPLRLTTVEYPGGKRGIKFELARPADLAPDSAIPFGDGKLD